MSAISPIGNALASVYAPLGAPAAVPPRLPGAAAAPAAPAPGESFARVFDQLVTTVESKQADANAVTRQVLLGDNAQLHQSVIARQEASVAFSLMVEVRNKVIESYQELMRMPV